MSQTALSGGLTRRWLRSCFATLAIIAVSSIGASGIAGAQQNTAYGTNALPGNTGSNNSAFGFNALANNSSGYGNTAAGLNALGSNDSGNANTAVGWNALPNNKPGARTPP
jgi:hypothetical protein